MQIAWSHGLSWVLLPTLGTGAMPARFRMTWSCTLGRGALAPGISAQGRPRGHSDEHTQRGRRPLGTDRWGQPAPAPYAAGTSLAALGALVPQPAARQARTRGRRGRHLRPRPAFSARTPSRLLPPSAHARSVRAPHARGLVLSCVSVPRPGPEAVG